MNNKFAFQDWLDNVTASLRKLSVPGDLAELMSDNYGMLTRFYETGMTSAQAAKQIVSDK
jgi:hypothetical protein